MPGTQARCAWLDRAYAAAPYCGAHAVYESHGWFGEAAPHLKSFALVALRHGEHCFGVLALASAAMPSGRAWALAAAAGMQTFIALLVLLSSIGLFVGPPMLLAAGLTSVATARASRLEGTRTATAFAVAVLLLLVGVGGELATIALR